MNSIQFENGEDEVRFRMFRRKVAAQSQPFRNRSVFDIYKSSVVQGMFDAGVMIPFFLILPDEVFLVFEYGEDADIERFVDVSDKLFMSELEEQDIKIEDEAFFEEEYDVKNLETPDKASLATLFLFNRPSGWEKEHGEKLPDNEDHRFTLYAAEGVIDACGC